MWKTLLLVPSGFKCCHLSCSSADEKHTEGCKPLAQSIALHTLAHLLVPKGHQRLIISLLAAADCEGWCCRSRYLDV